MLLQVLLQLGSRVLCSCLLQDSALATAVWNGPQYLVDGQLLPTRLQVSGVGPTQVLIAEVLLAAVVIH